VPVAVPVRERPPLDRETVERFAVERREPDWLRGLRLESLASYLETPWPRSDVGEEWRRFPIAEAPLGALRDLPASVSLDASPESGLIATDLQTAAVRHADLVRPYLARVGGPESHRAIRALAGAIWSAGAFVYVAPNTVLRRPVWVRRTTGVSRAIIVADRDSRVALVDELTSGENGASLAIPVIDVFVGPGASVDFVQLQRYGATVWNLGLQRYASERDSMLNSFNVVVGSGRSKVGVHSDIGGDGATVHLNGLVAAGGDQKIDINTFQDLAGSNSVSDLLYLAALYESAKAVYYGVIRVNAHTRGTSSYQECRNILLSDKAGADPIPVLEILTNDVARCGHGATAGAIDPTEVFYIMSRGLPKDQAEKLLVRGFFERVVGKIPDEAVRRRVLDALAPRIGRIAELDEEAA
jgi:Fe-S cluster assembly protein SufD